MTDKVTRAIEVETSAAMLIVLRNWALKSGRWNKDIHKKPYDKKMAEIKKGWGL